MSLLQTFTGFYTSMMTSVLAGARVWGLSFGTAAILQGLISIPVLIIAAIAASRSDAPQQRALILASAAPLVTPYAFNYDLTALSLALSWRMVANPDRVGLRELVFRLAWLSPIVVMLLNLVGIGIAPVVLLATFSFAVLEVFNRSVSAETSAVNSAA